MNNLIKALRLLFIFNIKYAFSSSEDKLYCNNYVGYKRCFVFLAANYGNLGDVAITYAQELFLKKVFQDYVIVDVPISNTLSDLKAIKNICTPEDIITIVGGGNMSDMYYDIEFLRQMIVNKFPNNKIYSFPQTTDFSRSLLGRFLKRKAQKCYSRHPNLVLMAREAESEKRMREMFKCRVSIAPDIVMNLDESKPMLKRNSVTFCMRNDMEKSPDSFISDKLKQKLIELGIHTEDYDTHIKRDGLSFEERIDELNKIWNHFRKSRWVVTDRLHGMIFSFITKTPCVVLPNSNYKIEKCYEWIKDCGYIYFVKGKSVDEIEGIMNNSYEDNFEEVRNKLDLQLKSIFL